MVMGVGGGEDDSCSIYQCDWVCSSDLVIHIFFFFKQKTAYEIYQCDWSSDVCSSDLGKITNTKTKRWDSAVFL